jgi:hypothetical protein
MTRLDLAYIPPVTGEVVEVYQKSGVATAKIALRLCHIEVPMGLLDDPHLADTIRFDADVKLRNVETIYSNGFSAAKGEKGES